jgi:hypothetical protein
MGGCRTHARRDGRGSSASIGFRAAAEVYDPPSLASPITRFILNAFRRFHWMIIAKSAVAFYPSFPTKCCMSRLLLSATEVAKSREPC